VLWRRGGPSRSGQTPRSPGPPPSSGQTTRSLSRPVRRPIDGGGVSGLACSSPGPARSTREEAAHVRCGIGSWGGQCLSLGAGGVPAAGGR
jgi:hypothetical protein